MEIEQYKRISHFLDADMTLAEMEAFEKELVANPAMRQQLDFEQALRDGFAMGSIKLQGNKGQEGREQEYKEQEYKEQEVWEKEVEEQTFFKIPTNFEGTNGKLKENVDRLNGGTPFLRRGAGGEAITPRHLWRGAGGEVLWPRIAVAASILIAIVSLVLIVNKKTAAPTIVQANHPLDGKKNTTLIAVAPVKIDTIKSPDLVLLYKKYFIKDNLPETYPMQLADAFGKYENGDYSSIQQLDIADVSNTRGEDELNSKQHILELGHYYKGIAFLETGNPQHAIINLNWIIKNSADKLLLAKARWYLALAFIKMNNTEKAIFELQQLHDKKAKLLLQVLE